MIWKKIENYEAYEINELGQVRKFGKDNPTSKPFWIKYLDGKITKYYGQREFERITGLPGGNIGSARHEYPELKEYTFKKGSMKNLTILF